MTQFTKNPDLAPKVRKRVKYAVTYEFENDAPQTVRGEIQFLNVGNAARQALKQAKSQAPRRKWSSLVILLDRSDVEPIASPARASEAESA